MQDVLSRERFDIRMRAALIDSGVRITTINRIGQRGCSVCVIDENDDPFIVEVTLPPGILKLGISQDEIDMLLIYRASKQLKAH